MSLKKNLFLTFYIFLSITSVSVISINEKHVSNAWPGGLFSAFLVALNHIGWCEKHQKIPVMYWNSQSLYYNHGGFNGSFNVWEYYFEPVSNLSYSPGDRVITEYTMDHKTDFRYWTIDQEYRDYAHNLIVKYIKIKPQVQKKMDQFYQSNMLNKKTIGIHLRGTDKYTEEPLVSAERIIQAALTYADQDVQFLIASDEQRLLDRMINLLKGRNVIYYDCYRSENGKPIHKRKPKPSPGQLGEDVLIEVLLLSKCQLLVHTLSNVSAAVLYFNPIMKNIVLR